MANTRNQFMQSMDNTLHDPHAVYQEVTLPSVSASIMALTSGQIWGNGLARQIALH